MKTRVCTFSVGLDTLLWGDANSHCKSMEDVKWAVFEIYPDISFHVQVDVRPFARQIGHYHAPPAMHIGEHWDNLQLTAQHQLFWDQLTQVIKDIDHWSHQMAQSASPFDAAPDRHRSVANARLYKEILQDKYDTRGPVHLSDKYWYGKCWKCDMCRTD